MSLHLDGCSPKRESLGVGKVDVYLPREVEDCRATTTLAVHFIVGRRRVGDGHGATIDRTTPDGSTTSCLGFLAPVNELACFLRHSWLCWSSIRDRPAILSPQGRRGLLPPLAVLREVTQTHHGHGKCPEQPHPAETRQRKRPQGPVRLPFLVRLYNGTTTTLSLCLSRLASARTQQALCDEGGITLVCSPVAVGEVSFLAVSWPPFNNNADNRCRDFLSCEDVAPPCAIVKPLGRWLPRREECS